MEINRIIQGNCLEVLKTLPDESVDMVITSPPYWALRDYGLEPTIWDGDENCEHNWGDKIEASGSRTNDDANKKRKEVFGKRDNWQKSNFCSKCNAWKGCLGLEPTFDLFIKHLCDIFHQDKYKYELKKKPPPVPKVCGICNEYFNSRNYKILKQCHLAIMINDKLEVTNFSGYICQNCQKRYFRKRTTKK